MMETAEDGTDFEFDSNDAPVMQSEKEIDEFLSEFADSAYKFSISRVEPKTIHVNGHPKKVNGHLETLHQRPTLDEIKETWGGGTYQIRVMARRSGSKGPKYVTTKRIEIAGDPKLKDDVPPAPPVAVAPPAAPALVEKVLDATLDDKRRAEDRFERVVSSNNPDTALLRTTLETMERSNNSQIETMRQQLERSQREAAEARQNRSAFENPEVLKVLFSRGNDDSARLAENYRRDLEAEKERGQRELAAERDRRERDQRDLAAERERNQRELAAERERHQGELRAERERHDRDVEQEKRDRESAIQMIERLHRSEIENLKASHAQLIGLKDEQLMRLHDELRSAKQNEKPHDTLSDLQRLGEVVKAVKGIVPEGADKEKEGDKEPKTGWEVLVEKVPTLLEQYTQLQAHNRAAEVARQAEIARQAEAARQAQTARQAEAMRERQAVMEWQRMAARPSPREAFAARPQAPVARPAQAAQSAATPVRQVPTGVGLHRPASTSAPVISPPAAAPTRMAPDSAASSPPASAPAPTAPPVTAALKDGLGFLKQAFEKYQPVADVARTAVSLFGKPALADIAKADASDLVQQIEVIEPDSLLASPGGRRYLRDFLGALREQLAG